MDLATYNDLFRVGRDEILVRNGRLTRAVVEREGSDANAFTAAATAVGDEVMGQLARVEVAQCLGAARGKDLTRLVYDRYGILRKPSAPAVGTVEFSTATPTASPFAIPVNTLLQTADGVQFVTTVSSVFPASSTGPVLVAVRSAQGGVSNQASVGTITNITSAIPGAPDDLAVTNTLATAGAADEQSDDSLREQARAFFTTARRGTLGAIKQGALAYPGVDTAEVFEVTDAFGRPAKAVQLMITDAFTETLAELTTIPATYQTQSQVLASAVYQALDDVRAGGIFVDVQVAKVVLQPIVLALTFAAGVNADSVALKARATLVAFVNSRPPGVALSAADLVSALRTVQGLIVSGGEILSPAGTVVPTQLEVLRTTLGLVVASTVQPDVALAGSTNPDAVN